MQHGYPQVHYSGEIFNALNIRTLALAVVTRFLSSLIFNTGFDRGFLSSELSSLSDQYQKLTYMHQKTQKENDLLKRQIEQSSKDFRDAIGKQEELKFELSLKNTSEQETSQNDQKEKTGLLTQCQALVQDSNDKSNIIIMLQARLLAVNEDRDELRRKVREKLSHSLY